MIDGIGRLVLTGEVDSCNAVMRVTAVRLWDSVSLMLVRFAIDYFSSIVALASDWSKSATIIWASIYCAAFSDAPYTWAAAIYFLQIW